MKLLHTSDWHLGRVLHGHSLLEDQQYMLDNLLGILGSDGYDGLIVSGDIYDRAVPPPEAVQLFSHFLTRCAEAGITAVFAAGNHDSSARLGFAQKLLDDSGIHIRTGYGRLTEPVVMTGKDDTKVQAFVLPFVEVARLREALGMDQESAYKTTEVISEALDGIRQARDPDLPAILVAHEFIGSSSTTSESERIFVGGAQRLETELFAGFDYVALGHLHRPQPVDGPFVRYSGSLLPYSFSEDTDKKGGVGLTFNPGELTPEVETVPFKPKHPVTVLKDTFEALLEDEKFSHYTDHYVSARLTDDKFHMNLHAQLRVRFPRLLEVRQLKLEADTMADMSVPGTVTDEPAELFEVFLDLFDWQQDDREWAVKAFAHAVKETQKAEREA